MKHLMVSWNGAQCSLCGNFGDFCQQQTLWLALGALALAIVLFFILKKRKGKGNAGSKRKARGHRTGSEGEFVEIYVGNLSYDMKGTQLRQEFEQFGTVKSARVIENRYNKKSKGFGFVEMPVRAEAEAAIKALHNKEIMGRKLRVNEARNKNNG